ncbi:MAG: CHASE domain-containing protein [Candidatus Ozemobacteraceae bacterium]
MEKHPFYARKGSLRQPLLMLVIGLIVTVGATLNTRKNEQKEAGREFILASSEIHARIIYRLAEHARILLSGSALLEASDKITRKEWHTFAQRQKIDQQFPSVQGFGFSLLIPREQLASHIQKIRDEGFPDYRVKPDGIREIYSSIIYLEPFTNRNLRAFGYDMFSEPVRRAAMERARDTDSPALPAKVVLVQETETDVQPGTLMYTPVYRNGMPAETVEQRRAAIYGWVYSPFRMTDLLQGIHGIQSLEIQKFLRLQIFDGDQTATSSLLYDSLTGADCITSASAFTRQIPIDFAGRRWTLLFSRADTSLPADSKAWLVLAGGSIITLLLFGLSQSMLANRFKDGQVAEQQASSRYARSLIEASPDPMVTINTDGLITDVNTATERVTGILREKLIGSDFTSYFSDPAKAENGYQQVFDLGIVTNYPLTIRHTSGKRCDVMYNATLYRDESGQVAGIFATARDITEHKRTEEEIARSLKEKEVLLKEIHHRVKNNMQVIYSLLNLQARNTVDLAARALLEESRDRVNTMAMVHEKLYQTKDLSHIDFREYLQSLVNAIATTYMRQDVSVLVSMESVTFDINIGIPCGLIVNELVSNSLKYAFPAGRKGTIMVGITPKGPKTFVLTVADDGVGFPEHLDFRNTTSLGLQLVNVLAGQIDGTIELSREEGTTFSINFSENHESEGK